MKKSWIAILTGLVVLCLCAVAGAEIISGDTHWAYGGSENILFSLDTSTGVITISGSGGWEDYAGYMPGPPWSSDYAASLTGALGDYRASIRKAVIQEGVTSIAGKAFSYCKNLTTVELPSTITRIGYEAFDNCTSLISIKLPNGLLKIEDAAFRGTSLLTSINIPSTVSSIGERAFKESALRTVETYGDLGKEAFFGCPLTSVVINNCTDMSEDGGTFRECKKLSSVTFNNCNIITIPDEAFMECPFTTFTIPATVTKIGTDAFKSTNLTSVTLPDGLMTLDHGAFKNTNLTTVTIPDSVIMMGNTVFENCSKLRTAVLSSGIGNVPEYTFHNCDALTDVTIPAGTLTIEKSAFDSCKSLRTIVIPEGVAGIREYAFSACSSLNFVTIPSSMVTLDKGAFNVCKQLTDVFYAGSESDRAGITITENSNDALLKAIWHYQEADFGSLTPGNVWDITYTWAEDYSTVTGTAVCKNKTDHKITETAEASGEVTTPATCEGVGVMTYTSTGFENDLFASQTTTADIPATGHDWSTPTYEWEWNDPVTVTASRFCANDAEHVETETVEAVYTNKKPTVSAPGHYKYTAAFENPAFETQAYEDDYIDLEFKVDGLKYELVSTGSNNKWTKKISDGKEAADRISAGEYVAIVTGAQKKTVTKLKITDKVRMYGVQFKVVEISDNAFKGLKKVTSVSIGKNVKKIGKSAFSGCSALTAISGGAGLTNIGDNAFASCVKLTTVPAFAKLTTIGASAFKGDKALAKITLGAKVKNIGKNAFNNCSKLKTIILKTKLLTNKTVGAGAFKGIASKPTVTCPKGKKNAYKELLLKKGMPKKTVFK